MRRSIRTLSFTFTLFLGSLTLFNQAQAQAPPCRPGTMAAVVGTSCSVGQLTFNFGNDLSEGITNSAAIGFIPVLSGNQAGFKLVLNFVDTSTDTQENGHFVQFSYSVQAAPQSEFRAESVSMEASAQPAAGAFDFVQVTDLQTFTNQPFFVETGTDIDIENGVIVANLLSQSQLLEVPGTQSTGSFFGGPTTQIFDFAGPGSSVSLTSATFLYTAGPIAPIPPAAPLTFKIIDLPNVPATFVADITNSGRTVGSITDSLGTFHGYIAEADGVTFTAFDFPGATATFGATLNDHGDVVGSYRDIAGKNHGFLLSDGNFTSIDVPDAKNTFGVGINNKGQIVGEYQAQDRGFHGFFLDKGVFTTIDHGPGVGLFASTGVFGINNASEMVGFFFDPNTFRAFAQKGGDFQAQDVPGQGDATNENLNNAGDIVGIFNDINLVQHGYLLKNNTFFTIDVPGGSFTFPLGINGAGTIVGQFTDADGLTHSYLATPGTGGGAGPKASVNAAPAATENCNSEAWQTKHAQRHHLTACHAGKSHLSVSERPSLKREGFFHLSNCYSCCGKADLGCGLCCH
jgi:hypothetical protein